MKKFWLYSVKHRRRSPKQKSWVTIGVTLLKVLSQHLRQNSTCQYPACDVPLWICLSCPWLGEVMLVRCSIVDDGKQPSSSLPPSAAPQRQGSGMRSSCDSRVTSRITEASPPLLVCLAPDLVSVTHTHPPPTILFALLGRFEGPWRGAPVLRSHDVSCTSRWQSTGEPPYLVDKDGSTAPRRLAIEFTLF